MGPDALKQRTSHTTVPFILLYDRSHIDTERDIQLTKLGDDYDKKNQNFCIFFYSVEPSKWIEISRDGLQKISHIEEYLQPR